MATLQASDDKTMMETAAERVASKMTGKPTGYSFDPTIIVTIISTLMSIFSGCLNNNSPEQVARKAKRMNVLAQAQILSVCRRNTESNREARAMFSAITDAASDASEEEILSCCQESVRLM